MARQDSEALDGAGLRRARERLSLGPVAMARALGMTYANYWRLERGGGRIRAPIARLVAALLEARESRERDPGDAHLQELLAAHKLPEQVYKADGGLQAKVTAMERRLSRIERHLRQPILGHSLRRSRGSS